MSGFTALNVEPEEIVEEDFDDTKEIQLEEAFKLYQNALKLHSQGPEYFAEAVDAYDELFKSEVFKYPEVVSEYAQDQLDEDVIIATAQVESEPLAVLASNAAESSANSVPQLVYLSYKSKGQFSLDAARNLLKENTDHGFKLHQFYLNPCKSSLKNFAEALERDDTDLDLWKKAARVADVLASYRISRFCLESVLAADDEDAEQNIDLSGLDEAFAVGQLDQVIRIVQDDLSELRMRGVRPRNKLLASLSKSNDPYHYLPRRPTSLGATEDWKGLTVFAATHKALSSTSLSDLGAEILQAVIDYEQGRDEVSASTIMTVEMPDLRTLHQEMDVDVFEDSREEQPDEDRGSEFNVVEEVIQSDDQVEQTQVALNNGEKENASDRSATTTKETGVGEVNEAEDTIVASAEADASKSTIALPTRKRSSALAGHEEPEGRTKSKRLRARESIAELPAQDEEVVHELPKFYLEQLGFLEGADRDVLASVNSFLSKLSLPQFGSLEQMKSVFWNSSNTHDATQLENHNIVPNQMSSDLHYILTTWKDEYSQAILHGHGNQDFVEKSAGLTLFLQHSKVLTQKEVNEAAVDDRAALEAFVRSVNATSTTLYDTVLQWLYAMLTNIYTADGQRTSPYVSQRWSPELKQTVIKLVDLSEIALQQIIHQNLTDFQKHVDAGSHRPLMSALELVQSIFELQLDNYFAVTSPSSESDLEARCRRADKLLRWAKLAEEVMQLYLHSKKGSNTGDEILVRYVWASTAYAGRAEDVDQNHVVLCLQDLRQLLQSLDIDEIKLPNNVAMPIISATAIDQEISRLGTLDFFMSVFDSDNSDPVAVIEKLEPLLEPSSFESGESQDIDAKRNEANQRDKLMSFLDSGDASLKLFLWRRLQNAYTAISYTPKIVSCLLRAIETIFDELCSDRHKSLEEQDRHVSTLKWIKDMDELTIKVLSKILNEPLAFDCIDEDHLRSSLITVTSVLKILHGVAFFEDSVRVGQITAPQFKSASSTKSYEKSRDRLREMQVRLWTLQYALFKESTKQHSDCFETAADDLANYLGAVHYALGQRHYCRYSNKLFVRLVKTELTSLETSQDYSNDLAQVFYDLYQLKFINGIGDRDHNCPTENLDKKTANSLIPTIMNYANKLSMKDLIKSELKNTVEKIQAASGNLKSPPALMYNKKLISAYLKSTINPSELLNCVKGIGGLPTRPVISDNSVKANKGWFFLLGYMTLAKYKSIKRVNPTPTEELDSAAALFRQDLEHNIEKWEAWYRLAQVFEAKIEDDLIWNSTKLNDSRSDIAALERSSIHAFTMAIAIVMRIDDDSPETTQKICDMFREFGYRLYASSREPLSMEAFKTDKNIRHLSNSYTQEMSKQPFHPPMTEYGVWHFAAYLLKRKFTDKAKPWTSHYTLAKCLWKMFQADDNARARRPVTAGQVLEACVDAIEALPLKERSNDYILEPHLKLVSIVHKMVHRQAIKPSQGVDWLKATRFAQKSHLSEDDEGKADWEPYILDILKKLGQADKSNWHHRINARSAHVIYDDQPEIAGALGAKHEFTQQIFTKTMTLQVWKPEHERPGRHYVYTGRYVLFFAHVLDQLNDRSSLDQLARRIRRKPTDFIDHSQVWEQVVTTYVKLLRRLGKVPEGRERAVFDVISFDEFTKNSEKLEAWALDSDTTSIVLDIMRDAIDLKKLNNSLMKGTLIDDLIGDSYASMYEAFVSQLPPEEQPPPTPAPLSQGTFINITTEVAPIVDDGRDRMKMGNFLESTEPILPVAPSALIGLGVQTPTHSFIDTASGSVVEPRNLPGKPGRQKTITRREVQRKAEAAIVKPPPIKTPILSKRPIIEITSMRSNARGGNDDDSAMDSRLLALREEEAQDSRASSRRGSIHDSADDESELSEMESGRKESKPLFPGLIARRKQLQDAHENDSTAGDGDDEADGHDDGDREGDEGEDMDDGDDADNMEEDEEADHNERDEEGDNDEEEDNDEDQEKDDDDEQKSRPADMEVDSDAVGSRH